MPYQWNAARERQMLLLAISSANLRPSADTWTKVASLLGEGLTASAVSQKYYKLRNEFTKQLDSQPTSTPSTPTKRKASDDDEDKKTPPSKRARKPKREPLDGVPFSDASDSSFEIKPEDMAMTAMDPFASFNQQFIPAGYFMPVNMPIKGGSSVSNSFVG
ncbi:hypothetical protein LTR99_005744 [Exophiala xenobiotica]|uniref:Myb-like domain-containing protein n=1 Tax=Vermiconidia calcicola TaxID=1690605 RepID=A0AAV9QDE2_9PEZI|nr:hypothetical protein LTR96_004861 [Exophiala xenobiotica]KAK5541182.1 hypothetical protein LTR25_002959 [Vermiconidia calcicola]KAK5549325.1 hypothetical protein LTR23_000433 [Chaetothyriales sp. CCFEE 6169]KAK5302787.1 hypothetical protein LTR99_005744 [Exophiala xenobiotica]KAK5340481.1 hypothetical protein LTR98_003603 [Exophiala xenobiotica]